jgi:uncharacterized membrane protein (DUF4010 family)
MDVTEFEDWLDRLGEDVSRWPDPQREAAQTLLADSAAARAVLEEAVALRRALAGVSAAPPVRAPAGLADRIVLQATQSVPEPTPVEKAAVPDQSPKSLPLASRPTVLLSLCFVAGILFGIFSSSEEVDADQVDLPAYVAHVVDMAHDMTD